MLTNIVCEPHDALFVIEIPSIANLLKKTKKVLRSSNGDYQLDVIEMKVGV